MKFDNITDCILELNDGTCVNCEILNFEFLNTQNSKFKSCTSFKLKIGVTELSEKRLLNLNKNDIKGLIVINDDDEWVFSDCLDFEWGINYVDFVPIVGLSFFSISDVEDCKVNNSKVTEKDIKTTDITTKGTWKDVKNKCRITTGDLPTDVEPTNTFIENIIISEHSPIRLMSVSWDWLGIKSWIATHWSRHKWEKFISTQRTDRTNSETPRDDLKQGELVNFSGEANVQQLIDTYRKRLCTQCSKETYDYAVDFKKELYKVQPEIANALVPNCIYRCGCPEFKSCELYTRVLSNLNDLELMDIKYRYSVYNSWFKEKYN